MGTNPSWHLLCCTKHLPASECFQEGNWILHSSCQHSRTLQHLSKTEHFPTLILVICRILPQKLLISRSTPITDSSYSCCNCFLQPCLYVQCFITTSKAQRKVLCWAYSSWELCRPWLVRARFFPLRIVPLLPINMLFSVIFLKINWVRELITDTAGVKRSRFCQLSYCKTSSQVVPWHPAGSVSLHWGILNIQCSASRIFFQQGNIFIYKEKI